MGTDGGEMVTPDGEIKKSWRPQNWKNSYNVFPFGEGTIYQYDEGKLYEVYESGADAMLKALKEQGWVILIPNET